MLYTHQVMFSPPRRAAHFCIVFTILSQNDPYQSFGFATIYAAIVVEDNSWSFEGMTAADFVRRYEAALATQEWEEVSPLLHFNASVTFSDGSVHKGKAAVRAAFERNFQAIAEENYRITNVHWLLDSDDTAVYMFDFHWSGKINGHDASGAGKGTSVLIRDDDQWKLLTEHLGPAPA